MKIAAFALLLSGVFTATMIPTAELKAEGGYGAAKYPWQSAAVNGVPGYGANWQHRQPNSVGNRFTSSPSAYRFRPWSGERPRTAQGAAPHYTAYNQMQQSHQGYRFRPMKPAQAPRQVAATPAVAYRPANITIPDHYVYRPLNPVKKANPRSYANNTPRVYPQMPRYGYGAYQPVPAMQPVYRADPRMIQRPSPAARYVYGNGRYSGHKFRPDHRGYAPVAYGNYRRPPMQMNRMPGYAYSRRPEPFRFRPAPQLRMPQPAYAYLPANRYPGMVQPYQAGVAPWGRYAAPMPYAYPNWRMPAERYAGTDNKRVNWYDGHSDGEGAWYKLTQQQSWPQVSQNWSGENNVYSQGPR
ncbi:MAG: hypothetical protein N0E59_08670 [Candidatus Thiodiazotropha taylori]|uniref:Uncharacterized protein n=1 Tax=Candidatus Thiodiazotropha taylori TaxID=2792791 RepID=A0A9E4P418_9GAMM|nr:hypothetical protein [Candidatus Thiodiazotropha taylori]MCG8026458.1 hypothetical protein [Candidatus Thiodiazotropha taylori]MCG8106679.1 hypothetical protein [Candidatus Thiodiazotropha taylori]MCG8110823.1 hypothetical protein [Candidatus Thiodiazotropha taylori]MCW4256008.1 hypothetical protein [Candidatus Thiodiazotropha taylori]